MTNCRYFWSGVLVAIYALSGCGSKVDNPVGSALVGQQYIGRLDSVVVSDPSALTVFLGRDTLSSGTDPNMLVGNFNGLAFRSLIRFEIPIDSLVTGVEGAHVTDFSIDDLSIELDLLNTFPLDGINLSVKRSLFSWSEETTYQEAQSALSLTASQVIEGIKAAVQSDRVQLSLPGEFVTDLIDSTTTVIQLDLLLEPANASDFLLDLASRNQGGPTVRIQYLVQVDRFGFPGNYQAQATADSYWGEVTGEGPNPDVPMLSEGIVFTPMIIFDLPVIPRNATVHFAQVDFEIDSERSFFESVGVVIDQVLFSSTSTEPVFFLPPGNALPQSQLIQGLSGSLLLNQILVQGWVSEVFSTRAIRLRPVSVESGVSWVVFKNFQMKLVYTNPIDP